MNENYPQGMSTLEGEIRDRAGKWLGDQYDEETRKQVQHLMDHDPEELTDAFYCNLEFGTGGLRGIMGVGTNRMNRFTVGMATQGLANYMNKSFDPAAGISVAIAYDCRNQSSYFAEIAAQVLSANGIKVFMFDELRPTPLLSFTVRELGCQSGIVITASHNPKEYNGYKVYWNDGGQLVPPHDGNIIQEVNNISGIEAVRFEGVQEKIVRLGSEIDLKYIDRMKAYSLQPLNNDKHGDLKIVFTPIHGSAVKLAPMALKAFGFRNVYNVPEQDIPDGDFPTVHSPNPEEPVALKLALDKARQIDAELVLATDPDADRVGVAVKNLRGEYVLLNGNQTATVVTAYVLQQMQEQGRFTGNDYIVKTIVTTNLLNTIAGKYGVGCYEVLTGFKYIAEIMRLNEGKKNFIAGGEESYGYLVGDYVRDKDAIITACFVAEAAAWARENKKSLYQVLIDIYVEHGYYLEKLVNITLKGKDGLEKIKEMMNRFRNNPPEILAGLKVAEIKDYKNQIARNLLNGKEQQIQLPKSDVIQYILEDDSIISMRPSGTEPKIKFYFGVKGSLPHAGAMDEVTQLLEGKIERLVQELHPS